MNGNGTTGIGAGASLAGRIRRAEFDGEWMYEEDAVSAGFGGDEDVKGKGKARDGDDADESESLRKSGGEHVMPVKREEFVRLVLQALREVGYRYVPRYLRRIIRSHVPVKPPKYCGRNPGSKKKTRRPPRFGRRSSADDGASPSRFSNPSALSNLVIGSPCAGKTRSRPMESDRVATTRT